MLPSFAYSTQLNGGIFSSRVQVPCDTHLLILASAAPSREQLARNTGRSRGVTGNRCNVNRSAVCQQICRHPDGRLRATEPMRPVTNDV